MSSTTQTGKHIQESMEKAGDKARDLASQASSKAKEFANTASQSAQDAASRVGSSIESFGSTIRENAPHSGMMGNVADRVASSFETSGRYLQEEGLNGLANDMTDMVRRNPLAALFVGVGVGFLLARATSRS